MDNYINAGSYVIGLCFTLWVVCSMVVLATLLVAFVTDIQARMPPLFDLIIPFRDEYGTGPDPISWFTLFQTVGAGLLFTILSLFLWPLYIVMALLYTARATYRHWAAIMKLIRATMNIRMTSPITSTLKEEKPLKGTLGIGVNSVKEPRWARPPEKPKGFVLKRESDKLDNEVPARRSHR